jgi:hypothetical protein
MDRLVPQLDEMARFTLEVFLDQKTVEKHVLELAQKVAFAEKTAVIAEKTAVLAEKTAVIAEKTAVTAEKNLAVAKLTHDLQNKNFQLMSLEQFLHFRGILEYVETHHGLALNVGKKRVDIWTGLLNEAPDLAQCIAASNNWSTSPEALAVRIEKIYDNLKHHHMAYTPREWEIKGAVVLSDQHVVSLLDCRVLACICQQYNIPHVLDLKEDRQRSDVVAPENVLETNVYT